MIPLVTVSLFVLSGRPTAAAEIYVNGGSSGAELGTPESPFRTVQAAINAAAGGDEIRVAAGTYVEDLRVEGKAVILRGGYSSGWVRDLAANITTLQGRGADAVINLLGSDATIDGFRITGGRGSNEELPDGYHGGGIYSKDSSPTITNNLIEGNDIRRGPPPYDYYFGGGIYVFSAAQVRIVNNVIRGNAAGRGSGVAIQAEEVLIQGNLIENNKSVGDHGGGIWMVATRSRITENEIRGNEVGRDLGYGWGGGLIVAGNNTYSEISFNRVYENYAGGYGAGEFVDERCKAYIHHELIYGNLTKDGCEAVSAIAVDGGEGFGSEATIEHCTVVGNVCENAIRGNGLQVEGLSVVRVSNCIFWNNGGDDFAVDDTSTLSVDYTCSQEAIAGVGNLSQDPRFVDEAGRDFHLAAGSPCIDAGNPASPFADEPGANGGRADMGRYGNAGETAPANRPDFGNTNTTTNPNGATGNQNSGGGNTQGGANQGGNNQGETGAGGLGAVSSTGLCPATATMMLTISLIGGRRRRHTSRRSQVAGDAPRACR